MFCIQEIHLSSEYIDKWQQKPDCNQILFVACSNCECGIDGTLPINKPIIVRPMYNVPTYSNYYCLLYIKSPVDLRLLVPHLTMIHKVMGPHTNILFRRVIAFSILFLSNLLQKGGLGLNVDMSLDQGPIS